MTFWLVLGLMTAVALAAVVWPLARRPAAVAGGNDLAVYRDQLEEIERDLGNGTIGAPEAEAARIEVSRRLIAAGDAAAREGTGAGVGPGRRWAAAAAAVAVPIGAVWLYLVLGSPHLPGQPLTERMAAGHAGKNITNVAGEDPAKAAEKAAMAALVAKVEAHLAASPDDGRGWEVIAPVYMRLERFDDAVKANRNALRTLGVTAERLANLGESLTAAADGTVTPEAKAELERAYKMDAQNVAAGFYLGLAAKQAGQRDEAARIWQDMIARAPADAEWLPFVKRALAVLDGPSPAQQAAAQAPQPLEPPEELPPEQRDMGRGMVERLAEKLRANGADVEGWLRLVRSYMVMADRDAARAAVLEARGALANEADKLARLESGVKQLGLEGVPPGAVAPQKTAVALPALSPLPPPERPESAQQAANANPHAAAGGADVAQDPQIRGMVDRLASRLRENGADVEGWVRLVRSYVVLGDREKARAAASDARRALSSEPDKLQQIEGVVKELGLEG